jgi:hypothetical protein
MLILTVIHVRTPGEHYLQSELSYWPNPQRGPFILQAMKEIPTSFRKWWLELRHQNDSLIFTPISAASENEKLELIKVSPPLL